MPTSSDPASDPRSFLAPPSGPATGGTGRVLLPAPVLPRQVLRGARVLLLLHRRGVAAGCAALAVWCVLRVLSASPAPGVPLQVAAEDLPAGTVLTTAHLRETLQAPDNLPDGVLPDPVGRTLASPVRRGEPLTDARILAPTLTAHLRGRAAVPVRVHDGEAVGLLQVGDRVDLVVVDPRGTRRRTIARDALVVGLPGAGGRGPTTRASEGRLVVLGVSRQEAPDVAGAGVGETAHVLWPATAPEQGPDRVTGDDPGRDAGATPGPGRSPAWPGH